MGYGEIIRAARSAQGMSQRTLAAHAGVGPSTIRAIEDGRTSTVTLDILHKLAIGLGLRLAALAEAGPSAPRDRSKAPRIPDVDPIPRRLRNILAQANITVSDVSAMSDAELLRLRGVGPIVLRLLRDLHPDPPDKAA